MLMHSKKPIIKIITTIKHLKLHNRVIYSFDIVKMGPRVQFGGSASERRSSIVFFINSDSGSYLLHNYMALKTVFFILLVPPLL